MKVRKKSAIINAWKLPCFKVFDVFKKNHLPKDVADKIMVHQLVDDRYRILDTSFGAPEYTGVPGDYLIQHSDGYLEVISAKKFAEDYEIVEE